MGLAPRAWREAHPQVLEHPLSCKLTPPLPKWEPRLPPGKIQRLGILSERLGFDRQRLTGWGIAQAVLSAWWTVEDNGHDWQPAIACAEHLATLVRE